MSAEPSDIQPDWTKAAVAPAPSAAGGGGMGVGVLVDGGRGVGGWRGDERDDLCTGATMTGDVAKQPTTKKQKTKKKRGIKSGTSLFSLC